MLRTILLICSSAVDPLACTVDTAIDVLRFPPERAAICAPAATQMTLARTALRPEPGSTYVKTICERVHAAGR